MIKMIKKDKGQRKEERRTKKADQAGRTGKVKQKAHTTYHQKYHPHTTTPVTPRCHHFQLTPLTSGTGSSGRTESLPFTGTFSSEEPRQRPLTCIGAKLQGFPYHSGHHMVLLSTYKHNQFRCFPLCRFAFNSNG
jgi:hypothetical protein